MYENDDASKTGGLVWFGYRLGTKPRFARGRSGMAAPTPCRGTVQGKVGASAVGASRWQSRQSRSVSDLSQITFVLRSAVNSHRCLETGTLQEVAKAANFLSPPPTLLSH